MNYLIEHIGALLKQARLKKKLSQRALSEKVGVPQSHISKIENRQVDLQTSSLIEFSRALDLELMLVPRELVPTFHALMRGRNQEQEEARPLYRLEEDASSD